jgi:D-arabinose 1-dehydrogenase-like Zn-dependent alcohol dehydrogenase
VYFFFHSKSTKMPVHSASGADLSVASLFDFKNHVVLVTGGATGLGEMAAQGFVQNGARVFIASRKESELKKASCFSVDADSELTDSE